MPSGQRLDLDVLICGGGASGLWLLDVLRRRGHSCLLVENGALGSGQTILSQGIIHGGTKYALGGLLSSSARAIRAMPAIWRSCLTGEGGPERPDLSKTRVRADHCYLWRTDSLASRVGMAGARLALAVKPVVVDDIDRPAVLASCPGPVARLDEQVIDPASFIGDLAIQNRPRVVSGTVTGWVGCSSARAGSIGIAIHGNVVEARPRFIVLTAGSGNADLRALFGISDERQQSRPLHMVLSRSPSLPQLFGHCVDGNRTRATITTAVDVWGRNVWQIGGQIAEEGVSMDPAALIARAQREIAEVIPDVELRDAEWSTYRATRAEAAVDGSARPDDAQLIVDRDRARGVTMITAWPTKLALVPRLVEAIVEVVGLPQSADLDSSSLNSFVHPAVAVPPWDQEDWPWIGGG